MISRKYITFFYLFILIFSQAAQAENEKSPLSSDIARITDLINERARQNANDLPPLESNNSLSQDLSDIEFLDINDVDFNDTSLLSKAEKGDVCMQTKVGHTLLSMQDDNTKRAKSLEEVTSLLERIPARKGKIKKSVSYRHYAAQWFNKASEAICVDERRCNDCKARAQRELARLYEQGIGIEKNEKLAFSLYKRAVENPNFFSLRPRLAQLYFEGKGTKQSYKEAYLHMAIAGQCKNVSPKNKMCEEIKSHLSKEQILQIDKKVTKLREQYREEQYLKAKNPDVWAFSFLSGISPDASKNTKELAVRLWKEINAYSYDIEGIKSLIKAGAPLKVIFSLKGNTLLIVASEKGRLDIVKALIDEGVDVNITNDDGNSALIFAIQKKHTEVARLLIKMGADVNARNSSGDTALTKSKKNGSYLCVFQTCPEQEAETTKEKRSTDKNPKNIPVLTQNLNGTFAEIDTKLSKNAINILKNGYGSERNKLIEHIKTNSGNYTPPVLNAMCKLFFKQYKDDEAAFWCFAAHMRTRYDALICQNNASSKLKFGIKYPPLQMNSYLHNHADKVKLIIPKLIEWDNNTPYNYDSRWVTIGSRVKDHKLTESLPENLCVTDERKAKYREENSKLYIRDLKQNLSRSTSTSALPNIFKLTQVDFDSVLAEAENGSPKAQYDLTHQFSHLRSSIPMKERGNFAEKWLIKSAEQGYAPAMHALGIRYLNGFGSHYFGHEGQPQVEKGRKMLLDAGASGFYAAYHSLGNYYRYKKQYIKAYTWYSLAKKHIVHMDMHPVFLDLLYLEAKLHGDDLIKAKKLAQEYLTIDPKTQEYPNPQNLNDLEYNISTKPIIHYLLSIQKSITKMIISGTSATGVYFDLPEKIKNDGDHGHYVFHKLGGGVEPKDPPGIVLTNPNDPWVYSNGWSVKKVSTDKNEILAFLPSVEYEACRTINAELGIVLKEAYDEDGDGVAHGSQNDILPSQVHGMIKLNIDPAKNIDVINGAAFEGRKSGCYDLSDHNNILGDGPYVYYYVLVAL